jgi:hypothetical protein
MQRKSLAVQDPSFWIYINVQIVICVRPIRLSSEMSLQGNKGCVLLAEQPRLTSWFTLDLAADLCWQE